MRHTFLATALLLGTLTGSPTLACSIVGTSSAPGVVSQIAAHRDAFWVALDLADNRVHVARFSATASLERELVLEVPRAELDPESLVVDRRGRLWLQARPSFDENTEAEWEDRTWAVAFSSHGKHLARFEITGWGPFESTPDGEIYVHRTSSEGGEEALELARVGIGGLEPLFALPAEEYFGFPAACSGEHIDVAPLTGGRFAVLRTWGADGWLSIYDARGSRLARWPFGPGDMASGARVAGGPGSGLTFTYALYEPRDERRVETFDASGNRLAAIALPLETNPQLVPIPSGGFWAYTSSGALRRLSPTGATTAAFALDPPPDGISWAAHAARQRELARLPDAAPAERWLDALLYGDAATSARAADRLAANGASSLPLLLDRLAENWETWRVIEAILTADPAAPAAAVAHLSQAERATRIAFGHRLSDVAPVPPVQVLEVYRDLLEDLYVSGGDGESAVRIVLEALPPSDRVVAHQIEQVLERGRSPYFLDSIFVRFPTVAAALDAALAGPPEPRHHAVEVLHSLVGQLERRPPAESPQLERELRDWSRRWATSPEPEVALAGSLLALATGDPSELPHVLKRTGEEQRQGSSAAAILRLLRFYPEALDESAVDALLEALHCRDCRHHPRLLAAIRPLLGGEDFARALERYDRLPPDEPLPDRLFTTLTAEFPRLGESELLAFLDDPRLRAVGPTFRLARFLDRVHRFAADRPRTQQAARDAFTAVFTPDAIRQTEPDVEPKNLFAAAHATPRYGHWLGALEPASLHGLMDEVSDAVLAAIEPPPGAELARKAHVAWGFAQFVETSGRDVPDHLRAWGTRPTLSSWPTSAPPEPPGPRGLLQRLDRMEPHSRARWLQERGAHRREIEAALLTRVEGPSNATRAQAHVLLAELGSARSRKAVLEEIDAALARQELPALHLLAALVLHGDEIPAAALELAAQTELTHRTHSAQGTTDLATDRLARHLRALAWEEAPPAAIGAVRLLAALRDDLTTDFVTDLEAHHPNPEIGAAARDAATARGW